MLDLVFRELFPFRTSSTQNAEQTIDQSTTTAVLDSSTAVVWSNGDTNVFEQYNNNENRDQDKLTQNIDPKFITLIYLQLKNNSLKST